MLDADHVQVGCLHRCRDGRRRHGSAPHGEHLGGGMRIENQYLVTQEGVENLTPFPMELV